jgi:hypothetical protein
MAVRRAPALTGNLQRGRQGVPNTRQARVPIVKRTPTVTPKGPGNLNSNARPHQSITSHGR